MRGRVDAAALEEAADLGDALFERMKRDFGTAPDESELPLELVLYSSREAFARALPSQKVRHKTGRKGRLGGGWTQWSPCLSHVWLQAEAFDTRRLVLHELTHQFYARARPASRRGRGSTWYREGLAEWYGWHRRTKDGVAFGVFDVVARNRTVSRIGSKIRREDWSAWKLATGEEYGGYRDALALVGALRGTADKDLRARFARFEADVFARGGGDVAFARIFQGQAEPVEAAVRAYWDGVADNTWQAIGTEWDERAGAIEGTTDSVAVADPGWLGAAWERIEVEVELGSGPGSRGGIVFADARGKGSDLAVEVRRGSASLVEMGSAFQVALRGAPKAWAPTEIASIELPPASRYRLVLFNHGRRLEVVVVQGATRRDLAPNPASGKPAALTLHSPSLIVRDGSARFRGLTQDGRSGPAPAAPKPGK
ncbi:MAG: hypothetical protein P1V36_09450 [Planctomycetota bacterium]|nr:hypothetical protein [Planctomycetota bacterium]